MTLKSKPLAAIIVLILFGGILLSSQMGWWQTESSKVAATFSEGEFAGQANPADIRGSYTFGDVEKNFKVPVTVLAQAFEVQSDNPAAFTVKELEAIYETSEFEIGTASVRLFVAFYTGLPFDLSTDIYLPQPAVGLLEARNLSAERQEYLKSHGVQLPAAEKTVPAVNSTPAAATTASPEATHVSSDSERLIRGKTTFGELLTWGVPAQAIEKIIGLPVPAAGVALKDFCTTQGLNFEVIKPALQAEVDKLK